MENLLHSIADSRARTLSTLIICFWSRGREHWRASAGANEVQASQPHSTHSLSTRTDQFYEYE